MALDVLEEVAPSTSWHSYPSVYQLGHRVTEPVRDVVVVAEEKVDASQFSFGDIDGRLRVRSKGREFDPEAPDDLFAAATATVQHLYHAAALRPGWTYRGEAFKGPRHNVLHYGRVPEGNVVLFDVNPRHEAYLSYDQKVEEAARLGLEVVPRLYEGHLAEIDLPALLETVSFLGGPKVEGVVLKPVTPLYGPDKKAILVKYVSEAFKEVHRKVWGGGAKSKATVAERLVARYRTEARWQKAVQHLRERGELEGAPRDIGALVREVQADVLAEEADAIRDALFAEFKDGLLRGVVRGLPEWYKQQLAEEYL